MNTLQCHVFLKYEIRFRVYIQWRLPLYLCDAFWNKPECNIYSCCINTDIIELYITRYTIYYIYKYKHAGIVLTVLINTVVVEVGFWFINLH